MTTPSPSPYVGQFVTVKRSAIILVAIAAIVIGVVALIWPGAVLGILGFLFGIVLIISGAQRIAAAVSDRVRLGSWFALSLVAGIVVLIAGILCLVNPANSIVFLGIVVGIGWVVAGIVDLAIASRTPKTARTMLVVSGILSLLAGVVVIIAPIVAAGVFLTVAAILLILVGISVLITYPRASTTQA